MDISMTGPRACWEQDQEPDGDVPEREPLTKREAREAYDPDAAYDEDKGN